MPPPPSGDTKLLLNSSLIITNILYINELESFFKSTINYKKMWYDSSLTFQNLKEKQTNYLTRKDEIWTPYVMVLNMEAKEDCKPADIRTVFEVIHGQNSNFTESDASRHLNTFLYKGSENPINAIGSTVKSSSNQCLLQHRHQQQGCHRGLGHPHPD